MEDWIWILIFFGALLVTILVVMYIGGKYANYKLKRNAIQCAAEYNLTLPQLKHARNVWDAFAPKVVEYYKRYEFLELGHTEDEWLKHKEHSGIDPDKAEKLLKRYVGENWMHHVTRDLNLSQNEIKAVLDCKDRYMGFLDGGLVTVNY